MTDKSVAKITPARKDAPVKGHDAVLRAIQNDGRKLHVKLINGSYFYGEIAGRDKYTITIRDEGGRHVVFKHAIASFRADEKR